LYNDQNLGKGWFSGVYVNDQSELNFTDLFTTENRPSSNNNNNNNLIGAVGSFIPDDSQEYYVIPETDKITIHTI
jgi:hypothetical protein